MIGKKPHMTITITGCSSMPPNDVAKLIAKTLKESEDAGFGKVTTKLGSHKKGFDYGFDGFTADEWVSVVVDTKNSGVKL